MNERGQATIMVLGLALVCFAIAGLAVDGTRAFLFRRTLQNGADASALAGASALDETHFRTAGGEVLIARGSAEAVARSFIEQRGLEVGSTITADDDGVRVLLHGEVTTTFLGLIGIDELAVSAVAEGSPRAGAP
jgi:Flp pilus assembly protein TadG